MARADGVVIVSERYWAFAGTDGSLKEGRMPSPPHVLRAIPFARGLVRLAGSLSPLFRRRGVTRRRERLFLVVALLLPAAQIGRASCRERVAPLDSARRCTHE